MLDPDQRSMGVRAVGAVLRISMLGWDLAVPIASAAVLSGMLNDRYSTGPAVTVALLVLGMTVGAYNVWRQLRLELKRSGCIAYRADTQDGGD